jgi:uncharacterized protein YjeT (DUF2065 family)
MRGLNLSCMLSLRPIWQSWGHALLRLIGVCLVTLGLTGCWQRSPQPTIEITLYQNWQLQPGDTLAGYTVAGGLGDISLVLGGQPIYAPYAGTTQLDRRGCIFYSAENVPAYMLRLCGLSASHLGAVQPGDEIGRGPMLHLATLRKQPNGTWAMVEPDQTFIERLLQHP